MVDEVKGEEEEVIEEVVELSPGEEKARSDGWRPKEDYEGADEQEWFDWPEFNRRSELFGKINALSKSNISQNQKVDSLTTALKEMGEHNTKLAEVYRNNKMAELKSQKKQALEEADHDQVVELDEQMAELKEAKAPEVAIEETPELAPEIVAWMGDTSNKWYHDDSNMRTFADAVAQECWNSKSTPADMCKTVDERIRQAFPHKFGGTASNVPNKVAGNSGASKKGKNNKYSVSDLDDFQKTIGQSFVDSGAMKDMQEYVNQLADLGDLASQK